MIRQAAFLVICVYSSVLLSGDHRTKRYENHVYHFSIDKPDKRGNGLAIVESKSPHPAHGLLIEIECNRRFIEVYSGYNAAFEDNTFESFREWLRDESVASVNLISLGHYRVCGLNGFRAILVQSVEAKNGIVVEAIRLHRKSNSEAPGIWYEFRLKSDTEHYIEDSNLFNRLMFSFKPIKSRYFE
jgi:hypothetical protein